MTKELAEAKAEITKLHEQEALLPNLNNKKDVAKKTLLVRAEPELYWKSAEAELTHAIEWSDSHMEYAEWGNWLRWLETFGFYKEIRQLARKIKNRYPRRVALEYELDKFLKTKEKGEVSDDPIIKRYEEIDNWQRVTKPEWQIKIARDIVSRGITYYCNGAVLELTNDAIGSSAGLIPDNSKAFRAMVRGSGYNDYEVLIIECDDRFMLSCTCPWSEKGNICKHEVAALLAIEKHKPFKAIKSKRPDKPKLTARQLRQKIKRLQKEVSEKPEIKRIRQINERKKIFYEKALSKDIEYAKTGDEISEANSIIATRSAQIFLDDTMQVNVLGRTEKKLDIYMAIFDAMMHAYALSGKINSRITICAFDTLNRIEEIVLQTNDEDKKLRNKLFNYLMKWQKSNEFSAIRCLEVATRFSSLTEKQIKDISESIEAHYERIKEEGTQAEKELLRDIKVYLLSNHYDRDYYLNYLKEEGENDILIAFRYVTELIDDESFEIASHELDKIAWRTDISSYSEQVLQLRQVIARSTGDYKTFLKTAEELIGKCSKYFVMYLQTMYESLDEEMWRNHFLVKTLPALVKGKTKNLQKTFLDGEIVEKLLTFSENYGGLPTADLAFNQLIELYPRRTLTYYLDEIGQLIQNPTTRKEGVWAQYLRRLEAAGFKEDVRDFIEKMAIVYSDEKNTVKLLKSI